MLFQIKWILFEKEREVKVNLVNLLWSTIILENENLCCSKGNNQKEYLNKNTAIISWNEHLDGFDVYSHASAKMRYTRHIALFEWTQVISPSKADSLHCCVWKFTKPYMQLSLGGWIMNYCYFIDLFLK